jgi:outer membrane biogenesis lipoprotein LolB
MQQLTRNRRRAVFFWACFFFLNACQGLTTRVAQKETCTLTAETEQRIDALKRHNMGLETFKGIGRITLYQGDRRHPPSRIAWIGASPDKMRAVLSSISGQTLFSFASDGRWLYLFDHLQQRFYKQRANRYIMKKVFAVSIELEDIVGILSGRVPLHRHRFACLYRPVSQRVVPKAAPDGAATGEKKNNVLVLKGSRGDIIEKIYLANDQNDARKIEVFDADGMLAYRAELDRIQEIDGFRIPADVIFSNDTGSGFRLEIERCWPHADVTPSVFVLSPPKP